MKEPQVLNKFVLKFVQLERVHEFFENHLGYVAFDPSQIEKELKTLFHCEIFGQIIELWTKTKTFDGIHAVRADVEAVQVSFTIAWSLLAS